LAPAAVLSPQPQPLLVFLTPWPHERLAKVMSGVLESSL